MSPSVDVRNTSHGKSVPYIPLSYRNDDLAASALQLVLSVRPEWKIGDGEVKFARFTDGITNTLLKCVKPRPALTKDKVDDDDGDKYEDDDDVILLRAYGNGTQLLIDREREFTSHTLLAQHRLAPPLLGRFENGLLYRFIRGRGCMASDLSRHAVWRAVARRLGEWHAVLPVAGKNGHAAVRERGEDTSLAAPNGATTNGDGPCVHSFPGGLTKPSVTLWTVMQRWISVLPEDTAAEAKRKSLLQTEFRRLVDDLADLSSFGTDGLVFGHCDLLAGNIVIEPAERGASAEDVATVHFIDYEYATPSPAPFDISNHFAEWAGLDCDYRAMPSRSQRRAFLSEYLRAYRQHASSAVADRGARDGKVGDDLLLDQLFREVDRFRGVPGFFWGVWGLVQAKISQIDFDYRAYAELRLREYWDWRAESSGARAARGEEQPLRERRWARQD